MSSYNLIWYNQPGSNMKFYFKQTATAENGQHLYQSSFKKPEGIFPIDIGIKPKVYLQVSFNSEGRYSLNAHIQK